MQLRPLADRMRPLTLDDVQGQDHLVGPQGVLRPLVANRSLPAIILWGPPGSGKTTLAEILARSVDSDWVALSAVSSGIREIREFGENAQKRGSLFDTIPLLFVDEIHRFNKAQQDALLPFVERGTFTLIGATTENPGFEINSALLSRCQVFQVHPIDDASMAKIITRAVTSQNGLPALPHPEQCIENPWDIDDDALSRMIQLADNDARVALNLLELAAQVLLNRQQVVITQEVVDEVRHYRSVRYDKAGDEHYNTVSAFIKSLRGSDPHAALYYMTRMLEGGEDPQFILRRMVIFASEDIGNANPQALQVAMDAQRAYHFIGMPEGVLPMTQACTYLATSPKSNAVIVAYRDARQLVKRTGTLPVPPHLINAPTSFAKRIGHGRGYKYPHDFDGNYVPEQYLPEPLQGTQLYKPTENGDEKGIKERLEAWERRFQGE